MRDGDKKFRVYKHPVQGFQAVKAGFSWPAFFFFLFWMLSCRLWAISAIWLTIYLSLLLTESFADNIDQPNLELALVLFHLVAYLTLILVPAYKGNSWREKNLISRGYDLFSPVQAQSKEDAISKIRLSSNGASAKMRA